MQAIVLFGTNYCTHNVITIDYTLEHLYDCQNDPKKPGFYYFDSHYLQDFGIENNTTNKQVMQATYDRSCGEIINTHKGDTLHSYSKVYIPFGVR